MASLFFALAFVLKVNAAFGGPPEICAWGPSLSVMAGSVMSARVENAWNRRCQAILEFEDTTFLPITWSFPSFDCPGTEEMQFTIPLGVPNGEALVTWSVLALDTSKPTHTL